MIARSQNLQSDIGLFLIRAALAAVFIFHGGQKLFGLFGGHGLDATAQWMAGNGIPLPTLSALLAGSAEFFGGIALLLGVGARIAAVPMAFTMLVAILTAHPTGFDSRSGGMEYPLTLGLVLVAIALLGAGRLTLGRLVTAVLAPSRNERADGIARVA